MTPKISLIGDSRGVDANRWSSYNKLAGRRRIICRRMAIFEVSIWPMAIPEVSAKIMAIFEVSPSINDFEQI